MYYNMKIDSWSLNSPKLFEINDLTDPSSKITQYIRYRDHVQYVITTMYSARIRIILINVG